MYYLSMGLVILSSIFYHVSQKAIPKTLNPLISMSITYATALLVTLMLVALMPAEKSGFTVQLRTINWATYVLGFAIVGLELGFLLVYRTGWNISVAAILATVIVTVLMIPVGVLLFKEPFSGTKALGIVLSIAGIILINR